MVDQSILISIAILYVGLLFYVAWKADNHKKWLQSSRPLIYSLALGVYCSSWTFFGAVGQASSNLWSFLPIYLGPIFIFIFCHAFLKKLLTVGETQKITSIADFIGSRYGKSQTLSAIVTLFSIIGSLPYIALQLRAVTMAWATLSPPFNLAPSNNTIDSALIAALIMCVFAILFGTRKLEGRERNRGMVMVIALESIIKLLAFSAVSFFALYLLFSEKAPLQPITSQWAGLTLNINFFTQTLIATLAIICLPRQFHMLVVEYQSPKDLALARWTLPLYLLLFSILIIPIALSGHVLFNGENINPDSLALSLPVLGGSKTIATLAFIGGLSAATGMVIVASITLSVMISNELIAPIWLRISKEVSSSVLLLSDNLKLIRRVSIVLLLVFAWNVNKAFNNIEGLTEIGLLAFAASAQLSPSIIIGLYWQKAHRNGALSGLVAGYLLWFYCMIFPVLASSHPIVKDGFAGISWLRPEALFNLPFPDTLSHGVFWSLSVNISIFLLVSFLSTHSRNDQKQADAFVSNVKLTASNNHHVSVEDELSSISVKQLRKITATFVGTNRLEEIWQEYEGKYNQHLLADDFAPINIVNIAEQNIASIIGSATANKVIHLLHKTKPLQLEDITDLVDHTSKELRFNQSILETTIETISQGISVIDSDFRLIAWNSKYQKLFNYPDHLIYIGCPVEKLYRINAERGLYGESIDIDAEVEQRLQILRNGKAHQFERKLNNGKTIDVRSNPMPNGGFVTSYNDISQYREVLAALENSKVTLEERVISRTEDLTNANNALQQENSKRAYAENNIQKLHSEKSRFLAHTSHDLMQPLNAARLFVEVLKQKMEKASQEFLIDDLVGIDHSLNNAENLVEALRDISHLDRGHFKPTIESFEINNVINELVSEFQLSIENKGIRFRFQACSATVLSDLYLLRRILQNFLHNALNYTKRGQILLGCRRRGKHLEIQVFDTGVGISPDHCHTIFEEFVRLGNIKDESQGGLGLGLSIAKRSADLLNHSIRLQSQEGNGSVFSVLVPMIHNAKLNKLSTTAPPLKASNAILNLSVLCIDNDLNILNALSALLRGWGCQVSTANTFKKALLFGQNGSIPDIMIIDYHLDQNSNGVDCWLSITQQWQTKPPTILISADCSKEILSKAEKYQLTFLDKPVKPAVLLNMLRNLS